MRKFVLLPFAALLALVSALAPLKALAQSGSFEIAQHGKPVGTASFNLAAAPHGFDSTSLVRIAMPGLDYALSKTEQLSAVNRLRHVQLSATVNGAAVSVSGVPEAAQFLLTISARGRTTVTRLAPHSSVVFLADFDPGALETLLTLAVTRNNRDLWAILPKKAGSIEPVQIATYADEQGTLNGKPIDVHHLVATIAGAATDLFSGPENQLVQAELPQQGFALVRKGFVLAPPTKPGTPPAQ